MGSAGPVLGGFMGKVFRLTQRTVEAAACPPGRKDALLFDGETRGFGLRITAAGSKVFLAQYQGAAGKRRVVIGLFGVLTVEEARKRAKAILGDAAKGRDPFVERQVTAAAQRSAEAAAKALAAEEAFTFGTLIDEWEKARAGNRRASYLAIATAALRKHFAAWGDRPASGITTAEAVRLLDGIKARVGATAANRCLSYARAAFGWAEKRQAVASNPFRGIEAPSREKARDRVLSAEEVGAIWQAAESLREPARGFVRVLLLTLQRRDEVARLRWDELSDDLITWTLPAERAKNGKAHLVSLSEPARAILAKVPRVRGCPLVFPAASSKPVSAFSAMKRALDAEIEKTRAEAGLQPTAGWTMHDFRRAGVTALADMGFPPHVCDRLLNHVTGAISGVAAVYQRAEFLTERKAALDAWGAFVLRSGNREAAPANIVTLRGAAG
jgi:integrase